MEALQPLIELLREFGTPLVLAGLVVTGILVPKAYYDREIKRGDKATEATATTAGALAVLSEAVKSMAAEVEASVEAKKVVADNITALRAEVKELREDIRSLRSAGR